MSAFRKVFIATALVGAGLGVAFFLGHPVVSPGLQSNERPVLRPTAIAAPQIAKPASENTTVKVKLLPESAAAKPGEPAILEPPALLSSLAPIAGPSIRSVSISDLAEIPSAASTPSSSTASLRIAEDATPIATLRNEAPRPIGNEPRSPAAIRRMPPVDTAESPSSTPIGRTSDDEADIANNVSNYPGSNHKTAVDWPAAQSLPPNHQPVMTGYHSDPNTTPAANTAYSAPMTMADNRHFAPPPWPVANEVQSPRTHVIEDGDSLEKLASQYLDDPLRSKEIFELNREVLSNPDLLPIGSELKIPERVSRNSWDRQSFRLDQPSPATIRQAAIGNLVPIRHSLSCEPENEPAPRAQLTRPVAIE